MKLKSYKKDLLKELKDPEYASAYLTQALGAGDQATFLLAPRDVVEAGGGSPPDNRRTNYPVRPSFGLTTGRSARERLWVSTTAMVRIIRIEKSSAYRRMAEARLFKMCSESGI